jgi:hypothetical protein
MFERLQEMNNRVWEGHSRTFEDMTHAIGGAGLGLLLCSALSDRGRPIGFALIGLSAALHAYAYLSKPVGIATV